MSKIRRYKNYSIRDEVKRFFDECNNEFRFEFMGDHWKVYLSEPQAEGYVPKGVLPVGIRGIKESCKSLLRRFDEL